MSSSTAPKPSLFKKPSWAATSILANAGDDSDDALEEKDRDFFSRSGDFLKTVAEKERRKKEKAERKKAKDEEKRKAKEEALRDKRRSLLEEHGLDSPEQRSGKRRRVSDDDDEHDEPRAREGGRERERERERERANERDRNGHVESKQDESMASMALDSDVQGSTSQRPLDDVSHSSTARAAPAPRSKMSRAQSNVVEILSSDDEADQHFSRTPSFQRKSPSSSSSHLPTAPTTAATNRRPSPPLDFSDSDSDPEVRALKQQARARRKQEEAAEAERIAAASRPVYNPFTYTYDAPDPAAAQKLLESDPTIQLYITSPIPGTSPLIVTRRLSQRLQEVIEAWCSRQTFPIGITADDIIFTYKLRRLWGLTTCRTLGVKLDQYTGKVVPGDDHDTTTGYGCEHQGKVHLEALTEELWQRMKEEKARAARGTSSFLIGNDTETPPIELEDDMQQQKVLKIMLKAKGFKDVKLKVKPVRVVVVVVVVLSHIPFLLNLASPSLLSTSLSLRKTNNPSSRPSLAA